LGPAAVIAAHPEGRWPPKAWSAELQMNSLIRSRKARLAMCSLLGALVAAGALWWALFALKPYDISAPALDQRYAHTTPATAAAAAATRRIEFGPLERVHVGGAAGWSQSIRFRSFDGETVHGRLVHPADPVADAAAGVRCPLLLALHAMGRTQWRWWHDVFKGRPTIERTHLLTAHALRAGHMVVALDARGHGDRKDPAQPLTARKLLRDLHWWGRREPYERLIVDSVRDWRVLLDGLLDQPTIDPRRVRAAGYSMGAQMALLLAGMDGRVQAVAAMVPPHLDRKVAAVAPSTVAPRLAGVTVWLLTADDDEHATAAHNAALFAALPGPDKRHLRFSGGHVLPSAWVDSLVPWLAGVPGQPGGAVSGASVTGGAGSGSDHAAP
jgi:dienelactone hydrolase